MRVQRRFGRDAAIDDRDRGFLLAPPATRRWKRTWDPGPWSGDQGATPHCVGFAWAHWLSARPIRQYLDPHGIYALAQHLDEWEGTEYDGTSVRGAAKVLHSLGLIERYLWAFDVESLVGTLLEIGPAVVGTNWYAGMSTPDGENRLHVSGRLQGGHAWLICGVDTRHELFAMKNSWGTAWGSGGMATIAFTDMRRLIAEEGEVCRAVERKPKGK